MIKKDRPEISVYIAMSLDGYIARQDGSLDRLERGHMGDEDYGFNKRGRILRFARFER